MSGPVSVRYISDGTWFDVGTEVFVIDDYRLECPHEFGLFLGLHNNKWDEEVCWFDEFYVLGFHSE